MNKITIEFDNITKTKTQQHIKITSKLNTNVLSIAAAINELIEDYDNKTGTDLLDAMIFICDQKKKELHTHYEEDDDFLFEGDLE